MCYPRSQKRDLAPAFQFFAPDHFVAVGAEVIERAARPRHGEPKALLRSGPICWIFGALVEGHTDISAEGDLNIDRMLGSEKVRTPVEVRAEADAIISDFAQRVEREDLKAAGVGEQGARPTHESVQAAHAADGLMARAQVEVIGVAENDLRAEGFKHILRDGLDRSLRADGHEDRRFDGLMREDRGARGARRRRSARGAGTVESRIDSICMEIAGLEAQIRVAKACTCAVLRSFAQEFDYFPTIDLLILQWLLTEHTGGYRGEGVCFW